MVEEVFIIKGQQPLEGEVEISGYKNAAGPILAATLLAEQECVIGNLPLVKDILLMIDILKEIGSEIEWLGSRTIKIRNKNIDPSKIDFEKIKKARVSVLLIGPLLARFGVFKISRPGGDRIGLRPITTHLDAFRKLGAEFEEDGDFYYFKGSKLTPKEIILKEFSVTATENLMMTAALLEGETVIKMAAAEPQVQDLGNFLQKMGVEIEGLGTHTLVIKGKKELKGARHEIVSDPIETATFLVLSALTPGEVIIKKTEKSHLESFLEKTKEIGVNLEEIDDNTLRVNYSRELKPARVQALPFPGFPTDMLPFMVVLLTQAKGKSLIHDPLYENRLNYIHELRKMGADIEIVDPHRAFVFGQTPLRGIEIESWDIRAGASLLIAGLIAKGETVLKNIYQIDRGYEKIEKKLKKLGAKIERVKK